MSTFQRRLIVFALCTLFSTSAFASDGYVNSLWQEIWGNFIAMFMGDEDEGGSVYVPSGNTRPGGGNGFSSIPLGTENEGGSVYVPSGNNRPGGANQPVAGGNEGGSVYVPSG